MRGFYITLLLFISLNAFAQDSTTERKKPTDNWFIGGSVSFSLGGYNNTFLAGLHPHYGYTLTRWLDVAAVVNFEYYSTRDEYNNKYHNTTYGLGVFSRIYPVEFLFLQVEPEYNFIDVKYIPGVGSSEKLNLSAPSLLVGAGYTTSRSDKNTFTYVSILIDVIKDINSPYVDGYGNQIPVIRAGINIGIHPRHKISRRTE